MTQTERPVVLQAYLSYRDAPAALRWLERAFGFETTAEFPDDQGGIMHAELRRDDVAISVFSDEAGYDRPPRKGDSVGHGLYMVTENRGVVDAVHTNAVEAGARVIWPPADTEWGNYRCRVLDLEGYEWTFGTHRFGQTAGDWASDGPGESRTDRAQTSPRRSRR